MIDFRSEKELIEILKNFDTPKLFYKNKEDAGPDEELYFFEDENGNKYGLWSRDYMSELKYEANGLKKHFNIEVKRWVKAIDGENTIEDKGDTFALFVYS